MKLLLTGDWHLRFKKPVMRLDENYFLTQYNKIKFILETAKNEKVDLILQPGDFFDSVDCPYFVVGSYIFLFSKYEIPILCVPGQHDLKYHTRSTETTPLGVLEAAGVVKILSGFFDYKNIRIYGCHWGQDIQEVDSFDKINILLAHKMIVYRDKVWPGQNEYALASHLVWKYAYDLIVSGDNHQEFMYSNEQGKKLVNCGSLMRSAINQNDHKPAIYICDVDNFLNLKKIYIPVLPFDKIMDVDKAEKERARNIELDNFIKNLEKSEETSLDFLKNVQKALEKLDDENVKNIVEEVLTEESWKERRPANG